MEANRVPSPDAEGVSPTNNLDRVPTKRINLPIWRSMKLVFCGNAGILPKGKTFKEVKKGVTFAAGGSKTGTRGEGIDGSDILGMA